MEAQAQHVDGRAQQGWIGAADKAADGGVGGNQRPVAVDGQRRVGLVAREHEVHRLARGLQRRVLQLALGEHGGKARGDQQHVALAQGDIELLGQVEHHLARGLRASGLEEAQVLGRDLGLEREVELAHAPPLAPFAQQVADGLGLGHRDHGRSASMGTGALPLPRR